MRFKRKVVYYEDVVKIAKRARPYSEGSVYYCPYCLEREIENGIADPKPDTAGKLYINTAEHVGYCHRCSTTVVSRKESERIRLNLTPVKDASPDLAGLPVVDLSSVPPAWNNADAVSYLKSRNRALYPSVVKRLDLRWVDGERTVYHPLDGPIKVRRCGVLVPLKYRGAIRSYQIRYLTDDKKSRFHTMEGKKLLGSVKSVPLYSEISIAEGFYDAFALACMGFPNPVALLGKTPSKLQIAQLRELSPYRINFCLDEQPLNYDLLKLLKRELKTLESYKTWKWSGVKDPEEYYTAHPDYKFKPSDKKRLVIKI